MAKKILRIINRLNIGGPTYNAVYLSRYLQTDYETLLVAGLKDDTEGDSAYIAHDHGISPLYVQHMHRALHPLHDWRGYWEIRNIICTHKPDIVHTHAAKAGALGRLAAHHERVPIIIHTFHGHVFHSYFGALKTRLFVAIERYLASLSTAIVAISPGQKSELADTFNICPPTKIAVVPNGFDLARFTQDNTALREKFRNHYKIPNDAICIGIIGRLVAVKNHALFLQAFSIAAAQSQVPLRAVIIGDGELRTQVEAEAQRLGLTTGIDGDAQVVFTSWITNIETALPGLDVIALSSLNEGTPVSLVEAQAAGLPVISTDVGGVRDTIQAGETGILVPSGDAVAMAYAMVQLANDADLRKQMGERGRAFALQQYGYQRLVADMAALYQRLGA